MRALPFALIVALAASPAAAQKREHVSIEIKAGKLSGVMYVPDRMPAPAVMVLHTAYGEVEEADEKFAAALAREGFVALAPNYTALSKGKMWSPNIDSQLRGTVSWLVRRPEVAGRHVGAVGFSLGAHAVSLAGIDKRIKAVVVYYGAYDVRRVKGAKLSPKIKLPIDYAAKVAAPVLLLHGADDDEVPLSNAQAMEAALKAANKTVELVVYPNAYHRFDRGPAAGMSAGFRATTMYTYRYDADATEDAWKRTLAFFTANLGS